MCQQKPVTQKTLSKDILDSKQNSLNINTDLQSERARSKRTSKRIKISNLCIKSRGSEFNIHREQRKSNKPRTRQRPKEPPRLRILIPRRPLRMETPMMQHNQVTRTTNHQPNPAHPRVTRKRTQQPRHKHDEVRRDSGDKVRPGKTRDERKVEQD